jgi:hypothetical protein
MSEDKDKKPKIDKVDAKAKMQDAKAKALKLSRRKTFNYDQYELDYGKYHYHWANIDGYSGSNVETYEEIGYSKVLDRSGRDIRRKGKSLGYSQMLLRIPKEEYLLIQHYKLEEARDAERALGKRGVPRDLLPEEDIYGDVINNSQVYKVK